MKDVPYDRFAGHPRLRCHDGHYILTWFPWASNYLDLMLYRLWRALAFRDGLCLGVFMWMVLPLAVVCVFGWALLGKMVDGE